MKHSLLMLILVSFLLFNPMSLNPANAHRHKVYVDVNGLVCDFCARALEKVFSKHHEVSSIDVNLDDHLITISLNQDFELDNAHITKLVNDAGYTVVAIRHSSALHHE